MKKIVIAMLLCLPLSHLFAETGRNKFFETKSNIHTITWPPYQQVAESALIVVGRFELEIPCIDEPHARMARVIVTDILKGSLEREAICIKEIVLFDGFTGANMPSCLFPCSYILFLDPLDKASARQAEDARVRLKIPNPQFYQIVNRWRGAIWLDPKWGDVSNKNIKKEFGIEPQELLAAAKEFCAWFKPGSGAEKAVALDKMKGKGLIYDRFVEEARKHLPPPPP